MPDLASVLPTPTGDGKTYTFRCVRASSSPTAGSSRHLHVRSTFERLFSASGPRTDLASYYEGIVGAPACQKRPKRCDLSQGVVTDDDAGTVTIRLRAPDPEFLYKLALPYAASSRPAHRRRATGRCSAPARTGSPSTSPKRRVRLVRNRHFREWSKAAQPEGFPNEILIEMAGTDDANVTAVQRGRADWLWSFRLDRLQEARTRFAAQFHLSPRLFTLCAEAQHEAAALRRRARPPSGGVCVRPRAPCRLRGQQRCGHVPAVASERSRLRSLLPATPCTPTRGGAWTAPDLERARRLVAESGTQGMRVDVLGQTQEAGFADDHDDPRQDTATAWLPHVGAAPACEVLLSLFRRI